MTIPSHHPDESVLMDYAAGSLPEAQSLVVASHLALCPECRRSVTRFEAIGGAMLEQLPEETVADAAIEAMLARLDEPDPAPAPETRRPSLRAGQGAGRTVLPEPLRGYIGGDLDFIEWKPVMRGLEECELPVGSGKGKARLLRIKAGIAMPRHTHHGTEMTLVLTGGFTDAAGHYQRGDIAITDEEVDHKPVADPGEDCICIAVTDAPVRLTGLLGRILNPFVRF